jgi:hypothetical protein
MATIEERYKAATDYVRRAIAVVEARGVAYTTDPVTGTIEWYAGQMKTAQPRHELNQIDARWLRATGDAQRAAIAREAELLADRVEENLPGAPQDRQRTNLYKGEVARGKPATSYGEEVKTQAKEQLHPLVGRWEWLKDKADEATHAASSIGQWILVGGAVVLGWRAFDYLAERERARQLRAGSTERRRLNTNLVRAAEHPETEP